MCMIVSVDNMLEDYIKMLIDECVSAATAEKQQELLQELHQEFVQPQDEYNELEKLLDKYNRSITSKLSYLNELQINNNVLRTYLAEAEVAFSELVSKYETCKPFMQRYKENEEILNRHVEVVNEKLTKVEQKYESLKKHARDLIDKANAEIYKIGIEDEKKIRKKIALLRGFEIKYNCLMDTLEHKIKQCKAMEALISDVTGQL